MKDVKFFFSNIQEIAYDVQLKQLLFDSLCINIHNKWKTEIDEGCIFE